MDRDFIGFFPSLRIRDKLEQSFSLTTNQTPLIIPIFDLYEGRLYHDYLNESLHNLIVDFNKNV